LRKIDRATLDATTLANCLVLEGRALLQLNQADDAAACFKRAVEKIKRVPAVDHDVYANAKIGLGIALATLGKDLQAERTLLDACRLATKAAQPTLMKAYYAIATSLYSARGNHFQAFAYLLHRHQIALRSSGDIVLHAETLVEAQLARTCIPVKEELAPHNMCRLLRTIRRTGKQEVVQRAARWLAVRVRPARRVRGKRHPEALEHRSRRMRLRKR